MKKIIKRVLLGLAALAVLLWFAAGWAGAHMLLFKPERASFEDPAEFAGFPVEPVELTTADNVTISAWHVNAGGGRAVALFHGIGPSRRQMEDTARCYLDLGYSVLLADLRRHGKSGHAPTFLGLTERHDVVACMRFLRERYAIAGAHGFSLGAAAVAFALREPEKFDFTVLASCYDTAEHALYDRLDFVNAPHWPAFPFVLFAEWRLGVGMRDLRPLDCMAHATAPMLVLGGDSEDILKAGETVDLFNRCTSEKKKLHIFRGGKHVPIAKGQEEGFRAVLAEFLADATGA